MRTVGCKTPTYLIFLCGDAQFPAFYARVPGIVKIGELLVSAR